MKSKWNNNYFKNKDHLNLNTMKCKNNKRGDRFMNSKNSNIEICKISELK